MTKTNEAIEEDLREIFSDQTGREKDYSGTIGEAGLDSLDAVELIMALEECFNCEIPDETITPREEEIKDMTLDRLASAIHSFLYPAPPNRMSEPKSNHSEIPNSSTPKGTTEGKAANKRCPFCGTHPQQYGLTANYATCKNNTCPIYQIGMPLTIWNTRAE